MRYPSLVVRALTMLAIVPGVAEAGTVTRTARSGGVSALWMLANISYAGMRAQDSASSGWRILAFICGFPGTLLSFLVVPEGGERAYGIELPTARSSTPPLDDSLGL